MESGFKRFFLRKKSKSKLDLTKTPPLNTLLQTARYDEFAAGPAPTVGARPIKPSQKGMRRKSFSHLRAKSVGAREARQLGHSNSDARPRTAPNIQPPLLNGLDPSNSSYQSGISQNETLVRSESMQTPPNVPELPKASAEMRGPKYSDLLQAAVFASKTKLPSEAKRTSFDRYNESIASRNSRYAGPPAILKNKGVVRDPPTHRDKSAPLTDSVDTHGASFGAMRASRDAKNPRTHAAAGRPGTGMPQASAAKVNDIVPAATANNAEREGPLKPGSGSPQDIVPPLTPSESRRSKRKSIRQTDLSSQLAPALPGQPAPLVPLLDPSARLATRKRSKTLPDPARQDNVPDWRRIGKPAILTLKPFEAGSGELAAADSTLDSSISPGVSSTQPNITIEDLVSTPQPLDVTSADVPPRVSSNRSRRKRDKDKDHSRDLVGGPRNKVSEVVLRVRSASQEKATPSRELMDLTADGPARKAEDVNQNDYDNDREETIAPKADPLQALRASVVSANSYIQRGGDDVMLEEILHHRPSQSQPQHEIDSHPSTPGDVHLGAQPDKKDETSPAVDSHSPTGTTALNPALQPPALHLDVTPSDSRPAKPPLKPSAANASPKVSQQEPALGRTNLPISTHRETSFSSEDILPRAEADTTQHPSSTQAIAKAPSTNSPSNNDSAAVLQRHEDITPPSSMEDRVPAILTRDFAPSQVPPRGRAGEVIGGPQSTVAHELCTQKPEQNRSSRRGGSTHIGQAELGSQLSELDRSFAAKKQAAAEALLKLQALMAMPTWDETSTIDSLRESTKMPSHWRNLSIEDGSPVAPSDIFKRVKMPILSPPLSRHSTLSSQQGRGVRENPERPMNGRAEGTSTAPPDADLGNVSSIQVQEEHVITSTVPLESSEQLQNKRRGRSDTASSHARGSHSRMGSMVSAMSGTSAHSLPYHMVPARSSSMRDSDSGAGDVGESPKFRVGELGWH
ncbi:hypothetical protein EPUS_08809 [Endocarpon pusillum Z07020]|uniref:Uncharacterized protein n=1 Tax=Endocarpon pusillum (strain Z07020 / HMAS-L-300199) TaxID=1263415 RepID=U1GUG0_ENDPU|nr:uncharacterized protein EPUS_08809 [Endocarpon pusillum Z07020]ERF75656.1 hypothetical protein EPUS_08809 [Endocarpon pusillum Z07020]